MPALLSVIISHWKTLMIANETKEKDTLCFFLWTSGPSSERSTFLLLIPTVFVATDFDIYVCLENVISKMSLLSTLGGCHTQSKNGIGNEPKKRRKGRKVLWHSRDHPNNTRRRYKKTECFASRHNAYISPHTGC